MAILPLLALGFLLTLDASHLVTRQAGLGRERAKGGGKDVVRDRFERDVIAVVDEPDSSHAPSPAHVGREGDLPAGGDLHGGHAIHHIDGV
jgi:hypothetical protein